VEISRIKNWIISSVILQRANAKEREALL